MKTARWIVRLLLLAAALFFIIGGPLPVWMERVVPALSPLAMAAETLAQRTWYLTLFWLLPPLAILLLSLFKGRFFCQWICPLGTLYGLPQKISLKKKILPVRLNALVFWIIISSSVLGIPLLLFLDPLSTVSRLGAWQSAASWVPGLLIPLFFLLSFIQPQVWCTHLCPLGYSFDLVNIRNTKRVFRRDRRQFLAGCGIGAGAAAILPPLTTQVPIIGKKKENKPSVLPPGANNQFAETCTRCYACVSACPTGIIKVKKDGSLAELAMPELVFDDGTCEESCNRCSQVCPTGAIRNLTHKQKHVTQIGVAKVQKDRCLAWADKEYCMVCDEYCPYNAIEEQMTGDVPCPVILPEKCRGCGACENACPAFRAGKAIFVHALDPQTTVTES